MTRTLVERFFHTALSLFAVTLVAFGLVRLTGDPVLVYLPGNATAADEANLRAQLGLDQPVEIQYLRYLEKLSHGDLGVSFQTRTSVDSLIAQRLPATLVLGGVALVIVLGFGIPLGVYSAYWQGSVFDHVARFIAVLGQSAPQFWVGLLLILIVAVRFGLLPAGGYEGAQYIVLPAVTIAWASMAGITRLMRSSMLEVLNSDYIKFVRMKGLRESQVLWKHALRNAALPVLTLGGLITADLVTGTVVVETIFAWPGIGQLTINSIQARDFPIMQAAILLFCGIYIVMNLIVDVLYVVLNPRLRTV
jgi:ABC-type dipeptide/oligopeptide/nickel transport system permease component